MVIKTAATDKQVLYVRLQTSFQIKVHLEAPDEELFRDVKDKLEHLFVSLVSECVCVFVHIVLATSHLCSIV